MADRLKHTATFSDGHRLERSSVHSYAWAYRTVCELRLKGDPHHHYNVYEGFSSNEAGAKRAGTPMRGTGKTIFREVVRAERS